MDAVNPMNVLNLLEENYAQQFELDDAPSEADKQFKEVVRVPMANTPLYSMRRRQQIQEQEAFAYSMNVSLDDHELKQSLQTVADKMTEIVDLLRSSRRKREEQIQQKKMASRS